MKKLIMIFLVPLFLLFQVNTVSAIMIDYLFSSQVEVSSLAVGDPIGMNDGNVEVKFTLNTETPPDDTDIFGSLYRSTYYDVLSKIELTDSGGSIVYSNSIDGYVRIGDGHASLDIDGMGCTEKY